MAHDPGAVGIPPAAAGIFLSSPNLQDLIRTFPTFDPNLSIPNSVLILLFSISPSFQARTITRGLLPGTGTCLLSSLGLTCCLPPGTVLC